MPRKSKTEKRTRRRYSEEFKREALALAERVGAREAATQLNLKTSQLYGWRTKAQANARQGEAEQVMASEVVSLFQQNLVAHEFSIPDRLQHLCG